MQLISYLTFHVTSLNKFQVKKICVTFEKVLMSILLDLMYTILDFVGSDIFRRSGSDPMPMEALQKTRLRIFGRAGDRKDVPNTVIFITKSMRKESEIMREAGKLKLKGTSIIGVGKEKA